MRKYSKQRESIKNFLASRTDHPTAETIYTCLREEQPHLSLGTVYRNLSLLTELGEIRKLSTGCGPDHFDGNISRHHHFICKNCQKVSDLRSEHLDRLIETAADDFPGRIDECTLNFFGLCENCLEKSKTSKQ